ncbi:MAG: phage tail protein [Bacillota bacterium]
MPIKTPNLDLYKVNGETDGNDTFNVDVVLNDNWDKIDAAVGNIKVDIPDASLTEKGIVQLSNATNGTRENVAATEKAVSDTALQAKSYTDQQISLVTETGIPKLVSYPLLVTATADNQKVFEIPHDLFDANTDTLLVAINRAVLDSTQYTVTNTVRNEAGEVTQRAKITLLSGVASTSEVTMVVLKNVPIGPEGAINGAVLAVNSVPINRVTGLQDQLDEAFQAGNERKAEVVAALVAIGVQASTSETWAQLIPKIAAVIRASGNATAADVLAGKTASNAGGAITGTIPNLTGIRNATGTSKWADGALAVYPEMGYQKGGPGDGEIKVSTAALQYAESGLHAANIREGTSIFGVPGTLKAAMPGHLHYPDTAVTLVPPYDNYMTDHLIATLPAGVNLVTYISRHPASNRLFTPYSGGMSVYLLISDSNNLTHQITQAVYASNQAANARYWNSFTLDMLNRKTIVSTAIYDNGSYPFGLPEEKGLPADFNTLGAIRVHYRAERHNQGTSATCNMYGDFYYA